MSSQHKLYNYEVSPPAEAWERIAQELNGVNEFSTISKKLQNLQVAPPAFAWEKISGELDDQQSFDIIAKKLSAVSVSPPADMWNKISEQLDGAVSEEKTLAPVVSIGSGLRKYAVAAAILALIAAAGYFLVQRSADDSNNTGQGIAGTNLQSPESPKAQQKESVINATPEAVYSDHVVTGKDKVQPKFATVSPSAKVVTTASGNMYSTTVEKNHEVDGRYIVLMTEEGNVVRLNKKVSSMADCIAGEDASSECTHQIAEWQKEMANMPVLASPDNILGLLALANKRAEPGL